TARQSTCALGFPESRTRPITSLKKLLVPLHRTARRTHCGRLSSTGSQRGAPNCNASYNDIAATRPPASPASTSLSSLTAPAPTANRPSSTPSRRYSATTPRLPTWAHSSPPAPSGIPPISPSCAALASSWHRRHKKPALGRDKDQSTNRRRQDHRTLHAPGLLRL